MSVSRYANVGQAVWTAPDGSEVPYLLRRLLPALGSLPAGGEHRVRPGERIDTIANSALGDATLSWLLGDANLATRPTLLATPGRLLAIPPRGGAQGASGAQ
ncbi:MULTISPECIES: hypothetical protein [Mycobacterium]|uniref:LysM domain-containing protein n=1 Tax=Mycobacterium kiyosense TaxID=2871094 RepID=A0A9P3QAD1_9MYCO|nr:MULTISPECIES: hypothetical protein [Mycobacterium]BDB45524.1 hypothetical protein IWGMT90018_59700 [Mycobacterium kiyosense]BDE11153.1 hypothetical protein MKCMC460_00130 [Mycobacterium sp. 20KCMC460]GLB83531.1 hypothetical protein SRL2020028_27870 [Mycobacterium kiyosense]GLB91404.1 hypothetical protein SRL2020130_42210 [Mycobacterium kiyosense]GLB97554.1 hypothetical protein SRL2020226_43300 [Mycobacterium kiyosense]